MENLMLKEPSFLVKELARITSEPEKDIYKVLASYGFDFITDSCASIWCTAPLLETYWKAPYLFRYVQSNPDLIHGIRSFLAHGMTEEAFFSRIRAWEKAKINIERLHWEAFLASPSLVPLLVPFVKERWCGPWESLVGVLEKNPFLASYINDYPQLLDSESMNTITEETLIANIKVWEDVGIPDMKVPWEVLLSSPGTAIVLLPFYRPFIRSQGYYGNVKAVITTAYSKTGVEAFIKKHGRFPQRNVVIEAIYHIISSWVGELQSLEKAWETLVDAWNTKAVLARLREVDKQNEDAGSYTVWPEVMCALLDAFIPSLKSSDELTLVAKPVIDENTMPTAEAFPAVHKLVKKLMSAVREKQEWHQVQSTATPPPFVLEVERGGYTATTLAGDDPLQVSLGYLTSCCQHLGGVGESCVKYGVASPNAGFMAIKKGKKVVAQSFFWEYAFSSVEETQEEDCVDLSVLVSGRQFTNMLNVREEVGKETQEVWLVLDNIETADFQYLSEDAIYMNAFRAFLESAPYSNIVVGTGYAKVRCNWPYPTTRKEKDVCLNIPRAIEAQKVYTDTTHGCWLVKRNNTLLI